MNTRRRRVRGLLIQAALLGTNHDREGCHLGGDAGAAGLRGLTSSSMAGRRGLSALTNAACCAAVRGSAGSPGEVATNASVRQHRDVGVPRKRPQQLPISHHLTTVIIISPDCSMRPPPHDLHASAARFSSNQSLSASLCTKRSGEDSAEREQETAGTKRSHSAPTEADSSNRAKQKNRVRSRPRLAERLRVRTFFGSGSQLQLQRRHQLKRQQLLLRRRQQPKRTQFPL